MERLKIVERLTKIFHKTFSDDSILLVDELTANDVNDWDSLTHIMLIVETEKKFNIKFLSSEIISWENVGKMIDCIEEKLK